MEKKKKTRVRGWKGKWFFESSYYIAGKKNGDIEREIEIKEAKI